MSDKPPKGTVGPAGDRKVTIRRPLIAVLDALAEELVTDTTELVNQAVREWLTKMELWPVAADDPAGLRELVRDWLRRQQPGGKGRGSAA